MELSENLMFTAMQRLILIHYQKILYVDLTDDFYTVLKVSNNEWNLNIEEKTAFKISEWFTFFSKSSLCHDNDRHGKQDPHNSIYVFAFQETSPSFHASLFQIHHSKGCRNFAMSSSES